MRQIKDIAGRLISRLVAINTLVILIVIFLAGLSVKNYACFLVNSEDVSGEVLVSNLNIFLIKVSLIAFSIAGIFHYLMVRRIVEPIKSLSAATRAIKEGKPTQHLNVQASGDLADLVKNFNSMADTLTNIQIQRDEMLKDIAHELRTPLTNINGYLEALHSGFIKGDKEIYGSLLDESRRISRIVELIAVLDSWGENTYFLDKPFEPLQTEDILSDSLKTFKLGIEGQFKCIDIQMVDACILGHSDGLKQVFSNLLQNLIDYNTGEKLSIQSKIEYDSIIINFVHSGQYINPLNKDLIFDRFYRMEASRTTKAQGAGLGLAIAKRIVEAHGGKIGVETDGNTHNFWVSIPITH